LNIFTITQGNGDPMTANTGNRVGDEINVRGIRIKLFIELPVDRSNTHFRIMLIKGAKGETFDRTTLFKGDSSNKMLDVINTERFTIVAQKIVTVKNSNSTASAINLVGVPSTPANAGIGTRLVSMWIPGSKFGKYGHVQYENNSFTQVKFFDYRLIVLCYDWFGTPQDANIVGRVNEVMTKMYFKDA